MHFQNPNIFCIRSNFTVQPNTGSGCPGSALKCPGPDSLPRCPISRARSRDLSADHCTDWPVRIVELCSCHERPSDSSAFVSSAGRENEAGNHAKFKVNKTGFVIKMVKPCARAPNHCCWAPNLSFHT